MLEIMVKEFDEQLSTKEKFLVDIKPDIIQKKRKEKSTDSNDSLQAGKIPRLLELDQRLKSDSKVEEANFGSAKENQKVVESQDENIQRAVTKEDGSFQLLESKVSADAVKLLHPPVPERSGNIDKQIGMISKKESSQTLQKSTKDSLLNKMSSFPPTKGVKSTVPMKIRPSNLSEKKQTSPRYSYEINLKELENYSAAVKSKQRVSRVTNQISSAVQSSSQSRSAPKEHLKCPKVTHSEPEKSKQSKQKKHDSNRQARQKISEYAIQVTSQHTPLKMVFKRIDK